MNPMLMTFLDGVKSVWHKCRLIPLACAAVIILILYALSQSFPVLNRENLDASLDSVPQGQEGYTMTPEAWDGLLDLMEKNPARRVLGQGKLRLWAFSEERYRIWLSAPLERVPYEICLFTYHGQTYAYYRPLTKGGVYECSQPERIWNYVEQHAAPPAA